MQATTVSKLILSIAVFGTLTGCTTTEYVTKIKYKAVEIDDSHYEMAPAVNPRNDPDFMSPDPFKNLAAQTNLTQALLLENSILRKQVNSIKQASKRSAEIINKEEEK